MSRWRHVSHSDPCRICNKPDWCSISADGALAICRRVDDGTGLPRVDKAGGEFWLYRLDGNSPCQQPSLALPSQLHAERAEPVLLDQVHRALLTALSLSSPHRQGLRQRGLPDGEILRRGYRTMPRNGRAALARRLVERFGPQVCTTIPGLYSAQHDGRRYWSIAGASGLLIPARTVEGRIVALKVRADNPGAGRRYTYISSTRHHGPGPGAQVHVPLHAGAHEVIRVIEGELKADVATVLSGVLTIAAPGIAAWRQTLPLLAVLQPARVLLAFDSDWRRNPRVARALAQATQALVGAGYTVAVETWNASHGKGIDDILTAGYTPTQQSPVSWLHRARTLPEKSRGRPSHIVVEVQ